MKRDDRRRLAVGLRPIRPRRTGPLGEIDNLAGGRTLHPFLNLRRHTVGSGNEDGVQGMHVPRSYGPGSMPDQRTDGQFS
jgi:hypothetical protein